jgi:hypothetical protein
MEKKNHIEPNVELIPYYEYDPSIHNIEYRYMPQAAEQTYTDFDYSYTPNSAGYTDYTGWQNQYRQFYPYYGYVPPRRRRRRRRRRPYSYGPGFVPVPLPIPAPFPYPPYYGPYPYF